MGEKAKRLAHLRDRRRAGRQHRAGISAFNTPSFLLLIALHKEPPGTIEEA